MNPDSRRLPPRADGTSSVYTCAALPPFPRLWPLNVDRCPVGVSAGLGSERPTWVGQDPWHFYRCFWNSEPTGERLDLRSEVRGQRSEAGLSPADDAFRERRKSSVISSVSGFNFCSGAMRQHQNNNKSHQSQASRPPSRPTRRSPRPSERVQHFHPGEIP